MSKVKTALRRILPLLILSGTLLISLALYRVTGPRPFFLSTSSPAGTYTVHLTGKKNKPHIPLIHHGVYFNALKGSETFISNKYLHSGDWFDPSFEILYPQHTWVSEDALRFYREQYFNEGTPSALKVVNSSGRAVKYLRVTADCMFLLFDTQSDSMKELSVPAPRGNLQWLSVEGEYSDGRVIEMNGVDFKIPKERSGRLTYYIYITEDGSKIESPQLEKYTGNE